MFWLPCALAALLHVSPPAVELSPADLTPVTRGLTLPRGMGEAGLGYQGAWGSYTFDLDGSKLRGDRLVPFQSYRDQSLVFAGTYGVTDRWELGALIPYTWRRFNIDRTPLVDTEGRLIFNYPDEHTNGLGDARFFTAIRPWRTVAFRFELKTASGADNFFPTRLPDARPVKYIGSGQSDLTSILALHHPAGRLRVEGEFGFRTRFAGVSNFLLRSYNPPNEILLNGRLYYDLWSGLGAGVTVDYMHEASATSVSVLYLGLPVWINVGAWQVRGALSAPLYGKDYPALFPEQLAEPQPLLGPRAEAFITYRWRD